MTTHFDNFSDFLTYAEQTSSWNNRLSSRSTKDTKWFGTSSFGAAMDLARNGWGDGRDSVEKTRAHFASVIGSRARRKILTHGVQGHMPDVGAYLAGEVESMFSTQTIEDDSTGRIIRMVVNGTASGGIDAEAIMSRGALIVALIDALESSAFSVELTMVFHGNCGGADTMQTILAKRAGEPVEIDRLAFCVAHPSMFRRLIFSCWEQDHHYMQVNGSSYGMCAEAEDGGDIYLPSSDLRVITDGDAVQWVRNHLAPLGITFDE